MAMKYEVTIQDVYGVSEDEVLKHVPENRTGVFRFVKDGETYLSGCLEVRIAEFAVPVMPHIVIEEHKEKWLVGEWKIASNLEELFYDWNSISPEEAEKRRKSDYMAFRIEERPAK